MGGSIVIYSGVKYLTTPSHSADMEDCTAYSPSSIATSSPSQFPSYPLSPLSPLSKGHPLGIPLPPAPPMGPNNQYETIPYTNYDRLDVNNTYNSLDLVGGGSLKEGGVRGRGGERERGRGEERGKRKAGTILEEEEGEEMEEVMKERHGSSAESSDAESRQEDIAGNDSQCDIIETVK